MNGESVKDIRALSKWFRSAAVGVVFGSIAAVLASAAAAFLFVKLQSANEAALLPAALTAAAAGAFAGGYAGARCSGSMGMAVGAVCGLLMTAVFLAAGLLMGAEIGMVTLLRSILMMLAGAAGGVVAVNRGHKRSKSGKRRK